jgi:hypothetical protein
MFLSYLFACALLFIGTEKSSEDCHSIREGYFKTVNYDEKGIPIATIIQRSEGVHVERVERFGIELKFQVDWISDCSYTLTWVETVQDDFGFGYPEDQVLTVSIDEVYDDHYIHTTTSNLFDFSLRSKIEILPASFSMR